jgi:hypothetical protein
MKKMRFGLVLAFLFGSVWPSYTQNNTASHTVGVQIPKMRVLYLDDGGDVAWIWNLGDGFLDSEIEVRQNGAQVPLTDAVLRQYHRIEANIEIERSGWHQITADPLEDRSIGGLETTDRQTIYLALRDETAGLVPARALLDAINRMELPADARPGDVRTTLLERADGRMAVYVEYVPDLPPVGVDE